MARWCRARCDTLSDEQMQQMMYFLTRGFGRWKYFNSPTDSFWCCTGTGVENHAQYGNSIYFHDQAGLFVNQFIPSELKWTEQGLRIRQETSFWDALQPRLLVLAQPQGACLLA
jgi:DUF1680 family protein